MARRYYKTTFDWGKSLVETEVCRIDFLNAEYGNKLKSVFYCPSYEKPDGRMCIYWQGKCTLDVGDKVRLRGNFNDGIFLVSSYQIIRKCEK